MNTEVKKGNENLTEASSTIHKTIEVDIKFIS